MFNKLVALLANVKVAEAFTVKFLQSAVVPLAMFGEKGVPLGITTSVDAVGIPPHQLDAVFQSVLVKPTQLPAVHEAVATFTIPVVGAKKVLFWFVAGALVLPHEPKDVVKPPRVSVLALWVNAPKFATADVAIVKFPVVIIADPNVTAPKVLLTVTAPAEVKPEILCAAEPEIVTPPVVPLTVPLPLFVRFPFNVNKKVDIAKLVLLLRVNVPVVVVAPPNVLVPEFDSVRLL